MWFALGARLKAQLSSRFVHDCAAVELKTRPLEPKQEQFKFHACPLRLAHWYGRRALVAIPFDSWGDDTGPPEGTLCYAIVPPGWKSGFGFGFRPDFSRGNIKTDPPAGLADFEVLPIGIRPISGPEARFRARRQCYVT